MMPALVLDCLIKRAADGPRLMSPERTRSGLQTSKAKGRQGKAGTAEHRVHYLVASERRVPSRWTRIGLHPEVRNSGDIGRRFEAHWLPNPRQIDIRSASLAAAQAHAHHTRELDCPMTRLAVHWVLKPPLGSLRARGLRRRPTDDNRAVTPSHHIFVGHISRICAHWGVRVTLHHSSGDGVLDHEQTGAPYTARPSSRRPS